MPDKLDDMMERASQALVRTDYATCERWCVKALEAAKRRRNWPYYARILLPLQEARRQRRMIAADGLIRLGTADMRGETDELFAWVDSAHAGGCLAVTPPHDAEQVAQAARTARERGLCVEVLFADRSRADSDDWTLRACGGPTVACSFAPPPAAWRDRDLPAEATDEISETAQTPASPRDWFLDACEALGDAALAQVDAAAEGAPPTVAALEPMLEVAPDHEILHQRLAAAAHAESM